MANLFENKDRRVVPNWRSFGRTTLLGELDSLHIKKNTQSNPNKIGNYIYDWKLYKTVTHGADLLSAAFVNNILDNQYVKSAASFILENSNSASKSQISLAKRMLDNSETKGLSEQYNNNNAFDALLEISNPQLIRDKINETRNLLDDYPYNAILYVELARYFSLLGNKEKSIKAMKTALHLSNSNRFILRSATRLFAHFDEFEIAHDILRKNILTSYDPWLTSAEIAMATLRERTSRFIKKGIELINSKNISPFHYTELASSLATVELLNGSTKKSRELFNKSIISPNDNSLAQVKWATQKYNNLQINSSSLHVKLDYEAFAFDNFYNHKYHESLDNAAKWLLDMPFSKRAVLFGANIASTIIKDQEKSIIFLNAGLVSHPNDPLLLNNIAYSLALENKVKEASEYLNKINSHDPIDENTKICVIATRGLILMREGLLEPGRHLYLEAIEQSKKLGNIHLNWIAVLNFVREEIKSNNYNSELMIDVFNKIPEKTDYADVNNLRRDVLHMYENKAK